MSISPFSITYACTCYRDTRCPACRAYDRKPKPWLREVPEPIPVGRPAGSLAALPPCLVAAHDELVAGIAAGEPYTALAERYGVSEYMLLRYIKRTGIHVPRAALKAEKFSALAPQILAEWAAGELLSVLARKYGVSPHAIRWMKRRADALPQRSKKGT